MSGIMKDDLKQAGYSQEEAYFHKLNRELIEKMKRKKMKEARNKKASRQAESAADENNYADQNFKKAA